MPALSRHSGPDERAIPIAGTVIGLVGGLAAVENLSSTVDDTLPQLFSRKKSEAKDAAGIASATTDAALGDLDLGVSAVEASERDPVQALEKRVGSLERKIDEAALRPEPAGSLICTAGGLGTAGVCGDLILTSSEVGGGGGGGRSHSVGRLVLEKRHWCPVPEC